MGKENTKSSNIKAKTGIQFHKSKGQHILKNPLVSTGIVEKAGLKSTDIVLEIGPGTGNLSVRILETAKKLIAIEADIRMSAELKKRIQTTPHIRKLEIINGDAIKTPFPYFDVCISNTPYQISSPLIFKLLEHEFSFRCAVLMFQREFAMRLVAKAGDPLYNRLSVNVQLYAKVSHVMKVSKNNFRPPPQVESSVVRIEPLNPRPQIEFKEWDGLVRILFTRKNKLILSNLKIKSTLDMLKKNYLAYTAISNIPVPMEFDIEIIVTEVVQKVNMLQQRAAKMEINDILRLLSAFHDSHIHFS